MSAPVPFCGFTGFKTRREVTQVLDSYTLSSGGNPAHGGRLLMIAASYAPRVAEMFDPQIAPPERVLRFLQITPGGLRSAVQNGVPLDLIDGVLIIEGWVPTPEDVAKDAELLRGKRVIVSGSSGMYRALGRKNETMLEVLGGFSDVVTDFSIEPHRDLTLDVAVDLIGGLNEAHGATHGIVLETACDHVSVVDLAPLWVPDRFPNLSLMMPLPVDKAGEGDDVEARYILRHAFGMTFHHRT